MFTDGMSRLAVAASVTVALSLAVFLTILVLLADLFCAHLRRKRLRAAASGTKLGRSTTSPAHTADDDAPVATTTASKALASTPPFYYAQGVMHAPNPKDLLLAVPKLEAAVRKWSPSRSVSPAMSSLSADTSRFMYISNPVYELGGQSQAAAPGGRDTPPFETPRTSTSPFGITEEEEEDEEVGGFSPPMSAMRKLPPLGVVACPPAALGFVHGRRPSLTDPNRASSSSSNLTGHFFSSWSPKGSLACRQCSTSDDVFVC